MFNRKFTINEIMNSLSTNNWYQGNLSQPLHFVFISNRVLTIWKIDNDQLVCLGKILFKDVKLTDYQQVEFIQRKKNRIDQKIQIAHSDREGIFNNLWPAKAKSSVYLKKSGRRSHSFHLSVDESIYEKILRHAELRKVSRNEYITGVLSQYG